MALFRRNLKMSEGNPPVSTSQKATPPMRTMTSAKPPDSFSGYGAYGGYDGSYGLNYTQSGGSSWLGFTWREAAQSADYARIRYPILRDVIGTQAIDLILRTIADLPCKVVDGKGNEVPDQPVWLMRPNPKFPELRFGGVLAHVASSLVLEGRAYVGLKRGTGGIHALQLIDPEAIREQVGDTQGAENAQRTFHIDRSGFPITEWGRQVAQWVERDLHGVGSTIPIRNMLVWNGYGITLPGSLRTAPVSDLMLQTINYLSAARAYVTDHYENYAARTQILAIKEGLVGGAREQDEMEGAWTESMTGKRRGEPKILWTRQSPKDDLMVEEFGDVPSQVADTSLLDFGGKQLASGLQTPLSLVGGNAGSGGSSYNSLQVQRQHWCNVVIDPLVRLIESQWVRALPSGQRLKIDTASVAQGDMQTRGITATSLVSKGIISRNEARELMGYAPLPEPEMDECVVQEGRGGMRPGAGREQEPVRA